MMCEVTLFQIASSSSSLWGRCGRTACLLRAIADACSMRLRPILMTTLATVLGLIPMALALEPGSEQYASLPRAILGGLISSGVVTVFLVPARGLLTHPQNEVRHEDTAAQSGEVNHV